MFKFLLIFVLLTSLANAGEVTHYKVQKKDTLGKILVDLGFKRIWSKDGIVKRVLSLNKSLRRRHGNFLLPNQIVLIPDIPKQFTETPQAPPQEVVEQSIPVLVVRHWEFELSVLGSINRLEQKFDSGLSQINTTLISPFGLSVLSKRKLDSPYFTAIRFGFDSSFYQNAVIDGNTSNSNSEISIPPKLAATTSLVSRSFHQFQFYSGLSYEKSYVFDSENMAYGAPTQTKDLYIPSAFVGIKIEFELFANRNVLSSEYMKSLTNENEQKKFISKFAISDLFYQLSPFIIYEQTNILTKLEESNAQNFSVGLSKSF